MREKNLSGVGFEPTPSIEDQKSLAAPYLGTRLCLESGALDHSANLTLRGTVPKTENTHGKTKIEPCQARTGDLLRVKQT